LGGPIGLAKADYLRELWGRFYDPSWSAGGNYTAEQKQKAGAFAAAIWEIVYEAPPSSSNQWDVTKDGTAGNLGFYSSSTSATIANNWLHSLDGTGSKANLRALVNCGAQDYLVEIKETPIPEPATLMLLGLGSLVLCVRKRIG
jgi:hypothetical protein